MLEHISEEALKKYKEKSLSSVELLQVCDHLESCLHCREKLAETNPLDNLFTSLASEFNTSTEVPTSHLSPDEIIAYVDSQLEEVDREIADSHLMSCALCRTDIQDLHAFKASLPVQPVKPELPEKQVGLWHKFLLFWHQSGRRLVIQAAVLTTVVFFFITTLYLKKQVSELHGTISELHSTVSELSQKNGELSQKNGELSQKNGDLQRRIENSSENQPQIARLKPDEESPMLYDDFRDSETLNDNGKQIALMRGSVSGISAPVYEQILKDVLSQQQVKTAAIPEELAEKPPEVSMGNPAKTPFHVLSPVRKIVESERPTLTWEVLEGAISYSVAIYDGNSNLVAKSPSLSSTTWTLSESLTRGVVYSWEVTAMKDKEEIVMAPSFPAPVARFKVLEKSKFDELDNAKRTYNSHLLSGTLYARAGLLDEAKQEFKALLAANPKSKLAQKLLRSVQNSKPQRKQVFKPEKHQTKQSPIQSIAYIRPQFQELSPTTTNAAQ